MTSDALGSTATCLPKLPFPSQGSALMTSSRVIGLNRPA